MLIKAAINGVRTRAEHPAVPLTPEEQAAEAAAAVAAGAGAIHVHVRNSEGRESLDPDDVARALDSIRASCGRCQHWPWIAGDVTARVSLVSRWKTLPDFASVNVHEEGLVEQDHARE